MKDRIKKYMDYKSISAGELASLLDVQRSNISHILNGRNMPGAALIEKFLISFPDLNARWLLTGIGDMVSNIEAADEKVVLQSIGTTKTSNIPQPINVATNKSEKLIDKVVILYADGTFADYNKK